MGIFDSHAHLDDEKFDNDREELIKNLKTNGVEFVVNPADRLESGLKALEIAKKYDFIYAALGVHPHEVKHTNDDQLRKIEDLAKNNKKVVAIGEIGLDYYYENSDRDTQKEYFRKQLDIAVKINKPVIIHSREATGDMYNILREYKGKIKGVMHCYSGSMEMAKEFIKLGFFISIGGVVTLSLIHI